MGFLHERFQWIIGFPIVWVYRNVTIRGSSHCHDHRYVIYPSISFNCSYFVHQRGLRLAAWGLCLSIGVGAAGIVSGYIIQDLGWQWTYKLGIPIFI